MLSSVWRDCTQKTCTIYMSYRVCRAQTTCMHVCSRDAQDSVDPHWVLTVLEARCQVAENLTGLCRRNGADLRLMRKLSQSYQ